MVAKAWMLKGLNFSHCSCAYGCPCQFNGLPSSGDCQAVVGISIDEGYHGETRLDGLRFGGLFRWPGPIHQGRGEGLPVIDARATPRQRDAILRIMSGEDSEPGATFLGVYSAMLEKVHEPVFAEIELSIDVNARRARLVVPGLIEARGEPLVNPMTGREHRIRIDIPQGFEFKVAEIGRGWAHTSGPLEIDLVNSHAHFAKLHITGSGVLN